MLAHIGSTLLITSILSYSIILLLIKSIDINKLKYIYIIASANIVLAFITLIIAFITLDFTVQNVLFNAAIDTPLIYKIAGTWASHEGSSLIWTAFLAVVSIYSLINDNFSLTTQRLVIFLQSIIMVSFTSFVYFLSNPLTYCTVSNGIGLDLNPILQDIGLTIHPPMLFFSYACYFTPFIYSVTALLQLNNVKELLNKSIFYSKIGLLSLTVSIALGSWWAYRVVGWGGYWFFDPVENVSLVVWIVAIIYYHSLLYAHFNIVLLRITILTAISTFMLSIFGTALVRSDILVSVHSFALTSSEAYFILFFFLILIIAVIGIYVTRVRKLVGNDQVTAKYKEILIILGNVLWFTALLVILISIFYSLIYKLIFDSKVSVNNNYFLNTFIPVMLPIALLASSVYHTQRNKFYYLRIATALLMSYLVIYHSYYDISIGSLGICASIYLIQESVYYIVTKSYCFSTRIPSRILSGIIGHLGLGIIILAISLNAKLQYDIDFVGKISDTIRYDKFTVYLEDINYARRANYLCQIATFRIETKQQEVFILKPEIRYYSIRDAITQACDIYSNLLYDISVVLSVVDKDNTVYAHIYYRPYMSMLWIGVMITSIGIFMSLLSTQSKPKHNNISSLELR